MTHHEMAEAFRDFNDGAGTVKMSRDDVDRLAALLDRVAEDARQEEREACAAACVDEAKTWILCHQGPQGSAAEACARRIRRRPGEGV